MFVWLTSHATPGKETRMIRMSISIMDDQYDHHDHLAQTEREEAHLWTCI